LQTPRHFRKQAQEHRRRKRCGKDINQIVTRAEPSRITSCLRSSVTSAFCAPMSPFFGIGPHFIARDAAERGFRSRKEADSTRRTGLTVVQKAAPRMGPPVICPLYVGRGVTFKALQSSFDLFAQ
jgi:hypothetical protein